MTTERLQAAETRLDDARVAYRKAQQAYDADPTNPHLRDQMRKARMEVQAAIQQCNRVYAA